MVSISEARAEVHRQMNALIDLAGRDEAQSATQVERALWTGALAMGAALMRLFFISQAARWRVGRVYEHEGRRYRLETVGVSDVGTKFGKVAAPRPVGRAVGDPRRRRDLPMTRDIGLPGGFTLPLVTLVARFASLMAFMPTRETLRCLLGWAPAPRSVLRMVDAVGVEVRGFLNQAQVPEGDTDVLLITVDGKGAPAISKAELAKRARPHKNDKGKVSRWRNKSGTMKKRRGPGKKSKNAKMAAVGVICTLRIDDKGRPRPVNKRIYATFTNYRQLFIWLKADAVRRGYGTKKFGKVEFVADGAKVLWELQAEFFPDVEVCLDWVHAVEKLWACGTAINRGSRTKREPLESWVHAQKKLLRAGRLTDVIGTLQSALDTTPTTGPGNKYRREVLARTVRHFTRNRRRMRYKRLRAEELVISSGLIEGTVRHLVGMRLDGPGMRWGKTRAEAVLQLRCVVLNGLWPDFEVYLDGREGFRMAAAPAPTMTHDAVRKAA